jgi:hypothetical protein
LRERNSLILGLFGSRNQWRPGQENRQHLLSEPFQLYEYERALQTEVEWSTRLPAYELRPANGSGRGPTGKHQTAFCEEVTSSFNEISVESRAHACYLSLMM